MRCLAAGVAKEAGAGGWAKVFCGLLVGVKCIHGGHGGATEVLKPRVILLGHFQENASWNLMIAFLHLLITEARFSVR